MSPVGDLVMGVSSIASFVLMIYWLAHSWVLIRHPEEYEAVQTSSQ
jgi:hypothetical protein